MRGSAGFGRAMLGRAALVLLLTGAAGPGFAATGAELAQACRDGQPDCSLLLERIAAEHGDDRSVCLPHGYTPAQLVAAYREWAEASDAELLAQEAAEKAALGAFKELFSCEE